MARNSNVLFDDVKDEEIAEMFDQARVLTCDPADLREIDFQHTALEDFDF